MQRLSFEISIVAGDLLETDVDVIVLKHAEGFYGADQVAASRLSNAGALDLGQLALDVGECLLLPSLGAVAARHVLFVGTRPLIGFRYQEVRVFARQALAHLSRELPAARRVGFTIHGPGTGLDDVEALESEVAGFFDAASTRDVPTALQEIRIVEIVESRVRRLSVALDELLPLSPSGRARGGPTRGGPNRRAQTRGAPTLGSQARDPRILPDLDQGADEPFLAVTGRPEERLRSAGYASASKPHIFVAMPFAEEMDDVYYFGIQGPVRESGFLCERADLEVFSGDIVQWIRSRIETASLVIAELTGANPNVYLEVGFAWGCGVPTVLLVRDPDELRFDVKGQRCLVYRRIKDLHDALGKELVGLSERA